MNPLKLAVLIILIVASAAAQAVTLKIATLAPDGTDWMNRMKQGAAEVRERTDNRVRFKFYPGGVMGDDKTVLRKMKIGQLQGAALTSGSIANYYPDSQIYNLPLKFRSLEEVDYVRERMDKLIVEGFEKAGLVTFGVSENGFAYIMSQKPIRNVEDLQQQKVWTPDNDEMTQVALTAFDVSPIPLGIGDVLTGLQTGLINTVGSSPVAAIALQWHNQVAYLTDLPILYVYAVMAIDKKAFKRISAADQAIVKEVMGKVFKGIDKQNRSDNVAAAKVLKQRNIQFIEPNRGDLDIWRKQAERATKTLVEKNIISPAMLALLEKHLGEFRAQDDSLASPAIGSLSTR